MTFWDSNPQISSGSPIVSIDAKNVLFSSSSSKDSLGNLMVAFRDAAVPDPDLEITGCSLLQNFLQPFGRHFGLKIRGRGRPPPPGPSPESTTVQFRVIRACPGLTM